MNIDAVNSNSYEQYSITELYATITQRNRVFFPASNRAKHLSVLDRFTSKKIDKMQDEIVNRIISKIQSYWFGWLDMKRQIARVSSEHIDPEEQSDVLATRIRRLVQGESFNKQLEILSKVEEGPVLFLPRLDKEIFNLLIPFANQISKNNTLLYGVTSNCDVADAALEHGANPNYQFALHTLCSQPYMDSSDLLKKMIQKGAHVNDVNDKGFTPLTIALMKKNTRTGNQMKSIME